MSNLLTSALEKWSGCRGWPERARSGLKERLFGLANEEGNHGEDVKEVYHYVEATPCHSYLKFLYRYPQAAYPYDELVERNRKLGRDAPESVVTLLNAGTMSCPLVHVKRQHRPRSSTPRTPRLGRGGRCEQRRDDEER